VHRWVQLPGTGHGTGLGRCRPDRAVGHHPSGGRQGRPTGGGRQNVDHVCIATSAFDHDALRTHLQAHNVTIEEEAFQGGARGMGHSVYIRDPFGNRLELKGPAVYPDGRKQDA